MKQQLTAALQRIADGDAASAAAEWEMIRKLPRTEDGLFDTASVDPDLFEAARWVYPVYAAYETECNKKEGYPDLLKQFGVLDKKYREKNDPEAAAAYLDALLGTIDNVSPQLYEYYRELVDMFRTGVKEAIAAYYKDGSFGAKGGRADQMIRKSIAHAGAIDVLLAEKYTEYC